jgi:hypothetical protein
MRIRSNRQIHTRDWAMLKCRICLIVPILSLLVIFSGCTIPDDSSNITELVVVGVSGEIKTLTLEDILKLQNVTGKSVYQNSLSFWQGKGVYTGVPLSTFAELMGGILPGDILIVSTVDNYAPQIFSYENIYPSESINQTQGIIILAYEFNNTLFPIWEDGLRIAFLPADEEFSNIDSQITASLESSSSAAGPRWAKYVNRLEFLREAEHLHLTYDEETHVYTPTQILRFPNLTASGRILFPNGTISKATQYTGVNLSLLVHLANRSGLNVSVEIHSSDDTSITLNSTQLQGIIPQYNSAGMILDTESQVTFLLVFQQVFAYINEGPFSLVVVGSESPISDSTFWLNQLVEIKLIW